MRLRRDTLSRVCIRWTFTRWPRLLSRGNAGSRCDAASAAANPGAHATGRDASDTAFLDNHRGEITLNQLVVTAVVDGDLPADSIDHLVSIR